MTFKPFAALTCLTSVGPWIRYLAVMSRNFLLLKAVVTISHDVASITLLSSGLEPILFNAAVSSSIAREGKIANDVYTMT